MTARTSWIPVGVTLLGACAHLALAQPTYYISVDIGSDLEVSDPTPDGNEFMDPGDVYQTPVPPGDENGIKDDRRIFFNELDPPPVPPVPVGQGSIEDYTNFFDLDGEDQLEALFEEDIEGLPIEVIADEVSCLWKEPNLLFTSFDDDQAPGWPTGDVPVNAPPDHGTTAGFDELRTGQAWRVWMPLDPAIDEVGLGLGPNPDQDSERDDDVDALDVERCRYWYWSVDREATFTHPVTSMPLDPGAIYVTDQNGNGFILAFSTVAIGVLPGTDIDGFEFCTVDDDDILDKFIGTQAGKEYLALLFTVDQDDPLTPADESGGLLPNAVYLSLFTGATGDAPMLITDYTDLYDGEDLDALAVLGGEEPQENLDFGDAPDTPYPTLLASDGARHPLVPGIHLGGLIDAEPDGQPTLLAVGDDLNGLADEDGVVFTTALQAGQPAGLQVTASTNGWLYGWIDYNRNGSWFDASDLLFGGGVFVTQGINNLSVNVPASAPGTNTYARFRFQTPQSPALSPTGLAVNGEVEDYQVTVLNEGQEQYDYGDAPDTYQTTLAVNGPRHVILPSIRIGSAIDSEPDGQPDPNALGDDTSGATPNDENEGIVWPASFNINSPSIVLVSVTTGGFLNVWLDTDFDGTFLNPADHVVVDQFVVPGPPNPVPVVITAPGGLGSSFARIRFSQLSGLGHDGPAPDGEVVDHQVLISQDGPAAPLVITNFVPAPATPDLMVQWTAETNVFYRVQTLTNLLGSQTWSDISGLILGPDNSFTNVGVVATNRHYRVIAPYTP